MDKPNITLKIWDLVSTFRKEKEGGNKGFGRKQIAHFCWAQPLSESQTLNNVTSHQLKSIQGFCVDKSCTWTLLHLSLSQPYKGDCHAIWVPTSKKRKAKVRKLTGSTQAACQRGVQPGLKGRSPVPSSLDLYITLAKPQPKPSTPLSHPGYQILEKWTQCSSPLKEGQWWVTH